MGTEMETGMAMVSDQQIKTEETRITQMDKNRIQRVNLKWLVVPALLLFMWACDFSRVYEDYKPIEKEGWHKDSLVSFNVDITDTISANNLMVNVRNMGNYPNSNIWLFVKIYSPDGKCIGDTIEYTLADLSGKWKGSGIGDIFDNQFPFKSNVNFPVSGEYRVEVQHGMRKTILPGISDIGIRIEKR
jgi:gliding motility-associated lipoprotein GldH